MYLSYLVKFYILTLYFITNKARHIALSHLKRS